MPRSIPRRRTFGIAEPLERRVLLSTIVWTNRVSSDNFSSVYGANASAARAIVDRALADWGRVIVNFNYGGGNANVYNVTVTAGDLGGGGRGVTNNVGTTNGKPSSADITMDDNGGGAGWYFDPVPGTATNPDDGEFTTLLTKFTANGPNSLGGNDFYRTIVHELGHAMGIFIGGSGAIPATNTGITDPNDSSAKIWKYVAPSGTYTYTDNGGGHVYEGPVVGGLPIYPNDLMNSGRTIGYPPPTRELITDDDALMLRDAHGYTITFPSSINTFLTNYNSTTDVVTINEDPDTGNDSVNVSTSGSNTIFTVDGLTEIIASSSIASITIATAGGINTINVFSVPTTAPVTITNSGVTTVNIGDIASGVQAILSSISIFNTSITSIVINDTGDSTGRTFTLDNNGTTATLAGLAPSLISWAQANVVNVTITGSSGADTFNIARTTENIYYNGNAGVDAINIGNATNGVQSVTGDLQFTNSSSFCYITINDTGDSTARTITHDNTTHSSSSYGRITGIAPGDIEYKYSDTTYVTIKTGSGADTVNVLRTSKLLNLDSAGGQDVVIIGSSAASGVQNILGQVTVDNGPSFTTLTIDDTGNSTARTITLDEASGYNTVAGLAPALIRFDDNDTSGTTIRTGTGSDTITVIRNDENNLTLTSAGGGDTITIGSASATGVQEITGSITITNPPAFTTLNITDAGNSTTRTVSIDTASGVTTVTGLAPAAIKYNTNDISPANGVTITSGSAADTITVLRSSNTLKFASTGGSDTITLGNATNGVQSILSSVNITNSPSFSNVIIDDSADTSPRSVTIASGSVTGLAPAAITWATTDISTITLNGGSGGNTFSASAFSNSTTINAGAANDAVVITTNAIGSLTLNGQGGSADSLTLTDSIAGSQTYNLTATNLSRGTLSVTYATIESITINAASLADTININGTAAATPVTVNAGAGTDTINVNETNPAAPVTIAPSTGNDNINVNTDATGSAAAIFAATQNIGTLTIGAGGTATLTSGGGKVLFAKGLSVTGGRLDLTDNSLLVDPGSASTIRGLLQTGYAAGAWNGVGIDSSSAAADPLHVHALGYAATADLGIVTYAGQGVGPSSVLVKYTYAGDANLNGTIDRDDFALADRGKAKGLNTWVGGDFDYSGSVTAADYVLLDRSFGALNPPAPSTPVVTADDDATDQLTADEPLESASVPPATPAPITTSTPAPAPANSTGTAQKNKPAATAKKKAAAKPKTKKQTSPAPKKSPAITKQAIKLSKPLNRF